VLLWWQEFETVGGSVYLHATMVALLVAVANIKYRSLSRLGLLTGNRWMSRLQDRSSCPGMP